MLPHPDYEQVIENDRRVCPTCGELFLMTLRKDSFNLRNNITCLNGKADFNIEWVRHIKTHVHHDEQLEGEKE